MGEYTFIVSKTCPICGESTRIIKLKSRIISYNPYYADLIDASLAHRAGLWLHLAWVYRAAGDEAHEREAMEKAAEMYDQSIMKEHYPQGNMTDNTAVYLIGAIYYRLGDDEKATQYLSRIIGDQNIRTMEPKTFDRARDLWQVIREKKEAAKS